MARHNRQLTPPPPARRPYGEPRDRRPEASARLDGACGRQDVYLAVRRKGVGLAMAARAGGSARPRASSRGYPRGRRGEAVGEAREVARRRAAASLRTLPRTRSTGGELSASARHLATFHRLPADRRTTTAPVATAAASAAGLLACVRCRVRVCCAARPLTSGCIVTCVWSRVYDVRVRGGARAPPHMRFIRY